MKLSFLIVDGPAVHFGKNRPTQEQRKCSMLLSPHLYFCIAKRRSVGASMNSLLLLRAAMESRNHRRVKQVIKDSEVILRDLCPPCPLYRPDKEQKEVIAAVKQALIAAMVNGSEFGFKDLWESLSDPIRETLLMPTSTESGLLHQVVHDARSPILVQWILEKMTYNAADELDCLGRTPLMIAAAAGQRQTVKLLVKFGANPLYSDPFKRHITAIDWASMSTDRSSIVNVQFLVESVGHDQALNLVLLRLHELLNMNSTNRQHIDRRRFILLCHTIMAALTVPSIRSHLLQYYPLYSGLKQLESLCDCDCTLSTLLHLCMCPLLYKDIGELASLNAIALHHFISTDIPAMCIDILANFSIDNPVRLSPLAAGLALLAAFQLMLIPSNYPSSVHPSEYLSQMDKEMIGGFAMVCDMLVVLIPRYPYPNSKFMQDVVKLLNPHFKQSLQQVLSTIRTGSPYVSNASSPSANISSDSVLLLSAVSSAVSPLLQLQRVFPDLRPSPMPTIEKRLNFCCGHDMPRIDDEDELTETTIMLSATNVTPSTSTHYNSNMSQHRYTQDYGQLHDCQQHNYNGYEHDKEQVDPGNNVAAGQSLLNNTDKMICWSQKINDITKMAVSWAEMTTLPEPTEQQPDPMENTLWRKVFYPNEHDLDLAEELTRQALEAEAETFASSYPEPFKFIDEEWEPLGGTIIKHNGGRRTYAQACNLSAPFLSTSSTYSVPSLCQASVPSTSIIGDKQIGEEASDYMQCYMHTSHDAMMAIHASPDPFNLTPDEILLMNKETFNINVYQRYCQERCFFLPTSSLCPPLSTEVCSSSPVSTPLPITVPPSPVCTHIAVASPLTSPIVFEDHYKQSPPKMVRSASPKRPLMNPIGTVTDIHKVICRRFEHKYEALKQVTLNCDTDVSMDVGQTLLIPQHPEFELGRSAFGGKVVLALAKRKSGDLAVVAVRSFAVSEQSNKYIRRLQEFVQPWKVHEGHLVPYRIFEMRADLGLWFLARDVCDWSLDEYLCHRPVTPPNSAEAYEQGIPLVYQMFSGLHFLHERTQNVFHGNLKPSNVLIDARNVLRLVDFGFGKLCTLRHLYEGTVTLENNRLHPICWKPPEFFSVLKTYVSRSDVHSAGMLSHYILTYGRRHPFITDPAMSLRELQMRVCNGLFRLEDEHGRALPLEGQQLLQKILSADVEQRWEAGALLTHPFFWTRRKKTAFVRAIASLVTELGIIRVPKTDLKALNQNLELFRRDWRERVPQEAVHIVLPNATPTLISLLTFIHKWYKYSLRLKERLTSVLPDDFFVDYYPWLVMHLYTVIADVAWRSQAAQLKPYFAS